MIFRVLGCSGSESDRNHPCSFAIGKHVVVDMGSAASRLTIEEQAQVTDVFLSHAHLDHTKDLAFFSENIFSRITSPVTVHATSETIHKLNGHILNNEIWPDFTILPTQKNSILKYAPFHANKRFQAADLEFLAIPVNHPGGCVALFIQSKSGTILYTGDTGPTEEVWKEVNRRGEDVKGILLECSFPDRLASLAEVSGHHTPASFARELKKVHTKNIPVFAYHLKAPYRDETLRELAVLGDSRIHILEPGMRIEF